MSLLKKTTLGLLFVFLMYFGGQGTQSANSFSQGLGAFGVIIALIVLFFLFKALSFTFRLLPSLLLFGSIAVFIFYCLGQIGSGSGGTSKQEYDVQKNNSQTGVVGQIGDFLFNDKKEENATQWSFDDDFNPEDYPAVKGYAVALSGSTINVANLNIRLLGIEAPMPGQTCADKYGNPYKCGQEAKVWLQNWLEDKQITCHIVSQIKNKKATGVCFFGQDDVAAVVTNAGWAVAYVKHTDAYVAYEYQANINKRGLWAGKFYKPWDWRKMQNRKIKVEIEDDNDSSILDSITSGIKGWF